MNKVYKKKKTVASKALYNLRFLGTLLLFTKGTPPSCKFYIRLYSISIMYMSLPYESFKNHVAHRAGVYSGFGSVKRASNNCLLPLGLDADLSHGTFRQVPKVPAIHFLLGGQGAEKSSNFTRTRTRVFG